MIPLYEVFLTGLVVTVAATLIASSWKVLAKPGLPVAEDLACGFELSVAAVAMMISYLPNSGKAAGLIWGLAGAYFVLPLFMAVVMKFRGYVKVEDEHAPWQEWRMRDKAAAWGSAVGGMALMSSFLLGFYAQDLLKVWGYL
jgi:hypothetical protein